MHWLLKQKNILDEPADALVCSANVTLNLSGGVGADLLARYGTRMQQELHERIRHRSPRCASRGEIFAYAGPEMPYKVVIHAVAVDGWYESSPAVVQDVTRNALEMAAKHAARKVALTALATGFGRLIFSEFAKGLEPLLAAEFPPVAEVVICLLLDFEVADLARALPKLELAHDQRTTLH
jgi:O-acetyl-ADP-ribose deacetylase (regulator of RNase III)